MHRRLNITLPEETVRLIDRIAKTGGRSRFINEAVREFVKKRNKVSLRKQLKEGPALVESRSRHGRRMDLA